MREALALSEPGIQAGGQMANLPASATESMKPDEVVVNSDGTIASTPAHALGATRAHAA